jgi:hypothetical protein
MKLEFLYRLSDRRSHLMLQTSSRNIALEKNLADRSDTRIDRRDYERLKLLERSHQILVVIKPLIHQIVAAEAANNTLLMVKLEQQLAIERDYLVKISRTLVFTIDRPLTTGEL